MSEPTHTPAVNPIPPIVVALCLLMIGVEAVLWGQSRGLIAGDAVQNWRLLAIDRYGFDGAQFDRFTQLGSFSADLLKRMVTYPFIHISFSHMIFAVVLTLALGKMVGEVFGTVAVLLVWVASSIFGAAIYGLLLNEGLPLIGAYPPVYGLIGAYTFMVWVNLAGSGQGYRAFSLIAVLMGIQLVFGLFFGGGNEWVADLSGFAAGFMMSFLVSPGGWQAVLHRIRNRD